MRPKSAFLIVIAAAAAGCTFDGSGTALPGGGDDDGAGDDDGPVVGVGPDAGANDPPDDPPVPVEPDANQPQVVLCRVDGEDLGVDQLNVAVEDAETVEFLEWTPRPNRSDEYIGFRLSANAADVAYRVTAGQDTYNGSGVEWINPRAAEEGDAPKITRIEFCNLSGGDGPGPGDDD
jgi:hypothetical protein